MILATMYFAIPLVLLMAPVFIRNRKFTFWYSICVGILISAVWFKYAIDVSRAEFKDGAAGAGFGFVAFLFISVAYVFGIALRVLTEILLFSIKLRELSTIKPLALIALGFFMLFTIAVLVFVVLPNWEWRWLIGKELYKFAEKVGIYFAIVWALTSISILAIPYIKVGKRTNAA